MAEWVRLRSYVFVLLKVISLPQVKCMHVTSHMPLLGWTWATLAVTIYIDGRSVYG